MIVLKQGTAGFINLFPEARLNIGHKHQNFSTTAPLKASLYGKTMCVCFHVSKRIGINLPLGDPHEVENMDTSMNPQDLL